MAKPVREVQPLNAELPMVFTVDGMLMRVRFSQSSNALAPIEVTPSEMVMFVSEEQPIKVESPIVFIVDGMVILVMLLFENTPLAIEVTPSGMVNDVRSAGAMAHRQPSIITAR